MAQWVKDPALSLQQLHLLLWRGFDPWPGELLPTAGVAKKEKKKNSNKRFCGASHFRRL